MKLVNQATALLNLVLGHQGVSQLPLQLIKSQIVKNQEIQSLKEATTSRNKTGNSHLKRSAKSLY